MKRFLSLFSFGLCLVLATVMLIRHQMKIPASQNNIFSSVLVKQEQTWTSEQIAEILFRDHPESVIPVECFVQGKQGFMDTTGSLVIPFCFDDTRPFSNGLAWVQVKDSSDRQRYGYINQEGVFVIPPELKYTQFLSNRLNFSENRLPLRQEIDGKIGYVDKRGEFVIEPQFDEAESFDEGLAEVCWKLENRSSSKCGYINLLGDIVIEPQFRYAHSFQEGTAIVYPLNRDAIGVIDKQGNYLVEPNLDAINDGYLAYGLTYGPETAYFSSDLLRVRIPDHRQPEESQDLSLPDLELTEAIGSGKWGYVRRAGGYAIAPRFWEATDFSQERAAVQIGEDDVNYPPKWRGKWALIDTTAKLIEYPGQNPAPLIESMKSTSRGVFSEGLAFIAASAGQYGYIDRQGQWIIPPQFTDGGNFSYDLAAVKSFESSKWGYIDRSGSFAISPQFDRAEPFAANGLAKVELTGKLGLINRNGRYVLEPSYSYISAFIDGVARVRLSEATPLLFVTESGEVLPYTYFGDGAVSEGLIPVIKQVTNQSQ